jgi:hypothetical protein
MDLRTTMDVFHDTVVLVETGSTLSASRHDAGNPGTPLRLSLAARVLHHFLFPSSQRVY